MSLDEIDDLLNHRSGLLGLCGDNDMREVLRRARTPATRRRRWPSTSTATGITEYVGAYYAVLGRVDAITFTAGVGENAAAGAGGGAGRAGRGWASRWTRQRNAARGATSGSSRRTAAAVAVCVVPTDEELEIADQARAVVAGAGRLSLDQRPDGQADHDGGEDRAGDDEADRAAPTSRAPARRRRPGTPRCCRSGRCTRQTWPRQ